MTLRGRIYWTLAGIMLAFGAFFWFVGMCVQMGASL